MKVKAIASVAGRSELAGPKADKHDNWRQLRSPAGLLRGEKIVLGAVQKKVLSDTDKT